MSSNTSSVDDKAIESAPEGTELDFAGADDIDDAAFGALAVRLEKGEVKAKNTGPRLTRRLRNAGVMAAACAGLTLGFVGVQAASNPESASAAYHPCGLSTAIAAQSLTYIKIEFWIRNCHSYGVHRKVDIANANDSACYWIPAGSTAHGYNSFPRLNGYVRGLASC